MKWQGTFESSELSASRDTLHFVAETGSSFWATWVRPTLRRRLEASPWIVWVIEFIGIIIVQNPLKRDPTNDLFT